MATTTKVLSKVTKSMGKENSYGSTIKSMRDNGKKDLWKAKEY